MSHRIVILSDTHMGRADAVVRSPAELAPLWRGADSLVINGDVAEVHDPRYRVKAAEQVLELHDLCERDGVDLTLLSGNHDPYISDTRHLKLANGAVFITHGDALHPSIAPWCPTAARVRHSYDNALATLKPEERDTLASRLSVTQHAAQEHWVAFEKVIQRSAMQQLVRRPWMGFEVLWYWHTVPDLAKQFAKQHAPEAKFFIFGHTHHQGVWQRDDLTIINTGSFGFPGQPRAVVIEDDRLRVFKVSRKGDVFDYADAPLAEYELAAAQQPANGEAA